jgi:hypothetical protein
VPKQRLLDTDTVTLEDLFSNGKAYRVPLYQRDYAWDEEQWDALWQDVKESRSAEFPHYMGALVLQRSGSKPEYQVIDGQQRLATVVTACVAALDLLLERKDHERFALLRARYVGSPDPGSLRWQSKLVLNETDDGFFQEFIVNQKEPPAHSRMPESNRRLVEARKYFKARWRELIGEHAASGEAIVDAFQETMGTKLAFTTITVDDELNAYAVFETLNARSLQLTSTDLLKNYLFSLLKGGKVDLDQAQKQWRRIVETVEAPTLPSFLRQFWISRRKLVRADRLFRALKSEVSTREQSFELLDGLEQAAVGFRALGDPNDEIWQESRECREHVRALTLLEVSQHYPLILACLRQDFDLKRLETVLRACLMVFMRHTVVGRRNPSELEVRFNQLAMAVSDARLDSPKAIWLGQDGRDGLRDAYVSDEDFRADFGRLDLARRGRKAKLPRYLLYRLDEKMGGPAGDFETSPETLEHVLPENPGANWSQFSEEDRRRFTNRLGNYVLLNREENRSLGNTTFEAKVEVLKGSVRPTTKMASVPPAWTPQSIVDRQDRLADVAVTVWRFEL